MLWPTPEWLLLSWDFEVKFIPCSPPPSGNCKLKVWFHWPVTLLTTGELSLVNSTQWVTAQPYRNELLMAVVNMIGWMPAVSIQCTINWRRAPTYFPLNSEETCTIIIRSATITHFSKWPFLILNTGAYNEGKQRLVVAQWAKKDCILIWGYSVGNAKSSQALKVSKMEHKLKREILWKSGNVCLLYIF